MAGEPEILRSADSVQELADELMGRLEDSCLSLSDVSEAVQQSDLDDEDAQALHDLLESRGIELADDCGRSGVEQTSYLPDALSQRTTDAMALFLQEVRRYPLLSREEEVELAKRCERGR